MSTEAAAVQLAESPHVATDSVSHSVISESTRLDPLGPSGKSIGETLVEQGYAGRTTVATAFDHARKTGQRTEDVLLQYGSITPDQLAKAIAGCFQLDYLDLKRVAPDEHVIRLIDPILARRHMAVPVAMADSSTMIVAAASPDQDSAIDQFSGLTGFDIKLVISAQEDIERMINAMDSLTRRDVRQAPAVVAGATQPISAAEGTARTEASAVTALPTTSEPAPTRSASDAPAAASATDAAAPAAVDAPRPAQVKALAPSVTDSQAVTLIGGTIGAAVQVGSSSVRLRTVDGAIDVRYRMNGVFKPATQIPKKLARAALAHLYVIAGIDRETTAGRVAAGVATIVAGERNLRLAITAISSTAGETIVVNILNARPPRPLAECDISEAGRAALQAALNEPTGLILVASERDATEPTLFDSLVAAIDPGARDIVTIERPIRHDVVGASQVECAGFDSAEFAAKIAIVADSGPSVLAINEIDGADSARAAVKAAGGSLVIARLSASGAAEAVTLMNELGVEPSRGAGVLKVVAAERSARRLCPKCRQPSQVSPALLADLGFHAAGGFDGFEAVGCSACGKTGHRGDATVCEIMPLGRELPALVAGTAPAPALRAEAIAHGMVPLRESALELARSGEISIAEAARICPDR